MHNSAINPVRAEYEFRSRRQGASESVNDYLTTLRTLYIDCDTLGLGAQDAKRLEEHNIAMQLAIGCYKHHTLEKLLQESTISLDETVKIMQTDETAAQSAAALRHDTAPICNAITPQGAGAHSTYTRQVQIWASYQPAVSECQSDQRSVTIK